MPACLQISASSVCGNMACRDLAINVESAGHGSEANKEGKQQAGIKTLIRTAIFN
jgi:hypothetical protein